MEEKYAVFIGFACEDRYFDIAEWPRKGEKAVCFSAGSQAGGMVANAACVCAGYGIATHIFDVKSTDPASDFLYADLEANHVDTSHMLRVDGIRDTFCAIYKFPDGDRSIMVVLEDGARRELEEEQLEFLKGAEYVYGIIGYGDSFRDAKELGRTLKEAGVKLFFDVESNSYREDWRDFLCNAYTVSMNEWGLDKFSEGKSQDEFIREIFDLGVTNLLLTLGENGCRLITRDGLDLSLPACKVTPVDCTGAGDTMNASFMAGCMLGYGPEEALRFATAAAGRAVTIPGPRGGVSSVETVRSFMEEQAL